MVVFYLSLQISVLYPGQMLFPHLNEPDSTFAGMGLEKERGSQVSA